MGLLKQGIGPHLSYEGLQQVIYSIIDTFKTTPKRGGLFCVVAAAKAEGQGARGKAERRGEALAYNKKKRTRVLLYNITEINCRKVARATLPRA